MLRYTATLNTLRVDVSSKEGAEAIARELPNNRSLMHLTIGGPVPEALLAQVRRGGGLLWLCEKRRAPVAGLCRVDLVLPEPPRARRLSTPFCAWLLLLQMSEILAQNTMRNTSGSPGEEAGTCVGRLGTAAPAGAAAAERNVQGRSHGWRWRVSASSVNAQRARRHTSMRGSRTPRWATP